MLHNSLIGRTLGTKVYEPALPVSREVLHHCSSFSSGPLGLTALRCLLVAAIPFTNNLSFHTLLGVVID